MKKNNKKGVTIVELVIVIAVIAILAAVLIPTFTGVTEKAQKSAAMQEANNAWINYLAEKIDTNAYEENICIKSGDYYFHVVNGVFNEKANNNTHTCGYTSAEVTGSTLTVPTP